MSTKFGYPVNLGYSVVEFLRDGSFDELLKYIENDLGDEWKHTLPEDYVTRERIYQELHALNRLQLKLAGIVESTKFN